jgi:hypothetical protein
MAVIDKSATQLKRERQALLRRAGMNFEELQRRKESYQLTVEQLDLLEAIENIDYLLADPDGSRQR